MSQTLNGTPLDEKIHFGAYIHKEYTIKLWEKEQFQEHHYIVAIEELTQAQRAELAPYCQCELCCFPWILFGVRLFIPLCPCCHGCLAADSVLER